MAAQINSNRQLTNFIAEIQPQNEESSYNIRKILQVSKTLQPIHNGGEDLSEFIGFRQLLSDELIAYQKLQELSETASIFSESINLTMMTHQSKLESSCYILHKAEGKTGLRDFLPCFKSRHLHQELQHQKQFRVKKAKPIDEEDISLLTQNLIDMDLYSHVDEEEGSDRYDSVSPPTSEESFETEAITHLDQDFAIRNRKNQCIRNLFRRCIPCYKGE